MNKPIGNSFYDELVKYGGLVGEHFSWIADGDLIFFEDTPESVVSGVTDVYSKHNPDLLSWSEYQTKAQSLLNDTDIVAIRCLKAGISYPAEWMDYTNNLRDIVRATSGDSTVDLPQRPIYPSGT